MKFQASFRMIRCDFDDKCINKDEDFACINCTRNNRLKYLKDNFKQGKLKTIRGN